MNKDSILIVDDEVEMLVSCRKILQGEDYYVTTAESGAQALGLMKNESFDLVICDLKLPDIDGLLVLKKGKKLSPRSIFVFITAYGTVDKAVEAIRSGAFNFIEKPFTYEKFLEIVTQALAFRRSITFQTSRETPTSNISHFDNIMGRSPSMQKIYELIQTIAKTDSNIMIVGESGTGKELVAQSIHTHSCRKTMPFVPINCGALPENIFESELFGHEKGAFTGAHARKIGLLEFAYGGTFFLDEVCALSTALQVKLLRMVQDRKIRRVGGEGLIDVDVRIISATNIDPDQALKDGVLREDLYYRLKVITIKMPPLRDRVEDIPLLSHYFLEKYQKLNPSKKVKGLASETLMLLQNYSWPGNVRELQNVVESAVALCNGQWIRPEDLPENIEGRKGITKNLFQAPIKEAKSRLIASFEREYLLAALEEHGWNISKAAKFSGVDRRTIQRMLRKHKIDVESSIKERGGLAAPESL